MRRASDIRVPHYESDSALMDMAVLLAKELAALDRTRNRLTYILPVAPPSVEHRIRLRLSNVEHERFTLHAQLHAHVEKVVEISTKFNYPRFNIERSLSGETRLEFIIRTNRET